MEGRWRGGGVFRLWKTGFFYSEALAADICAAGGILHKHASPAYFCVLEWSVCCLSRDAVLQNSAMSESRAMFSEASVRQPGNLMPIMTHQEECVRFDGVRMDHWTVRAQSEMHFSQSTPSHESPPEATWTVRLTVNVLMIAELL
mmetsp:Transcript_1889/g.4461  ORF Transcript_1889/g.4461 Transcript_1889/m.4461 type:complete len:145 (-) Transcript_1889:98-532(-)